MDIRKVGTICAAAGGPAMALGQKLASRAPVETVMGPPQKILYCHVPLAWWSLASFALAAVAGAFYLRTRRPFWDHLGLAAVESGMVLAGLALATGMIWARYAWGVWWTGDPRLATFLVLLFMYAGCMLLRGASHESGPERERRASLAACLSIVACLNVPLVFLSTRLLRSAHPVILGRQGGGLEPEMLLALLGCLAAMGLVWLGCLLLRLHLASLRDACAGLEYARLTGTTDFTKGAAPHERP